MICPSCEKGEVKEHISIYRSWFRFIKEVTTFCPLCNFINKLEFKISKVDADIENAKRLNLPKETIQNYNTNRREQKE